MTTNNFSFLSNDGKTAVHAVKWLPDSGEYSAILQISHGMVEYIERYAPFAEFLTEESGIDMYTLLYLKWVMELPWWSSD